MKTISSFLILFLIFFLAKKDNSSTIAPHLNIQLDTTKLDSLKLVSHKIDTLQRDSTKEDSVKTKFYYGIASYYSRNLEGTETATGEIFKHNKFTAASNRFELNTWVRVTRIKNGRSIIVRINDRMHPRMDKKGRIVDLSIKGAEKLGFLKKGLAKVKVEIVPEGTLK